MKLHQSYIKYSFTACLISFSVSALAQVKEQPKKEPEKASIAEEIEVVRPYKPILAEAVKIRRSPDLNDNKPFKPVLTYTVIDKKLELNSNIKELQAQQLAAEREITLSNNLVKIGVGNLNTGLGEVYINTGKDEALQAGMFIKHLSQQGSINKQQFSEQEISGFGRSIGTDKTYAGKIGYNRRSTFFYGFNPEFPAPTADPLKQRFNLIEAEGEMLSNYSQDPDIANYAVKANGYLFGNNAQARENSFTLSGYVNRPLGNFHIGIGASADYTGVKDSLYDISNNLLRANPYIKYQGNGFFLNLGLNLVHEFGAESRFNLLPAVSAEFPIAAEYAVLFAGLNGDVLKTSIRDLSVENPYLGKDYLVKNAIEKMNLFGGVKGNAGAGVGFKAMAYYKRIEDLPLFVNDPYNVSRFNVIYDDGVSSILGFEGEMSFKVSSAIDISGKAEAASYKMATEKEAWFKPAIRLSSNLRGRVNEKLSLDAEIFLNGESNAKTVTFNPLPVENYEVIKSYADLSAGAKYRINNKLGVYLRANNIFGKSYQQYLYYQKLGFNALGGFNYSF
ncbi:hypothetical protein GZH53_07510 [Flavihumibacter sp. R14]|nr:hypothetical protein [Flavihumibacter soli]